VSSQSDLFGQSLFDIVHPKDIAKVKEQISSAELAPRERLIDSKTMLPVRGGSAAVAAPPPPHNLTRLNPGARRSFICRLKVKAGTLVKEEDGASVSVKGKKGQSMDRRYAVIQCTGYLKSWPLTRTEMERGGGGGGDGGGGGGGDGSGEDTGDGENANDSLTASSAGGACMSCLVAVGRLQPSLDTVVQDSSNLGLETVQGVEFSARLSVDLVFAWVDQRVTHVLGYLPHELAGCSLYDYVRGEDVPSVSDWQRRALRNREKVETGRFALRGKSGSYVTLRASWRQFRNPWTKEIEYVAGKFFMCVPSSEDEKPALSGNLPLDTEVDQGGWGNGPAGRDHASIGKRIAEEEVRSGSASPGENGERNAAAGQQQVKKTALDDALDVVAGDQRQQQQQPQQQQQLKQASSRIRCRSGSQVSQDSKMSPGGHSASSLPAYLPNSGMGNVANDDTAMSVIMSLLEADGGLGGNVDLNGLPWPLP